jgi:hypothetical protein
LGIVSAVLEVLDQEGRVILGILDEEESKRLHAVVTGRSKA